MVMEVYVLVDSASKVEDRLLCWASSSQNPSRRWGVQAVVADPDEKDLRTTVGCINASVLKSRCMGLTISSSLI
jgi:hypothetical protein